jgi:hypothetical protein
MLEKLAVARNGMLRPGNALRSMRAFLNGRRGCRTRSFRVEKDLDWQASVRHTQFGIKLSTGEPCVTLRDPPKNDESQITLNALANLRGSQP